MSPTRTREHELEDESRRAFESAIPGKWVVRNIEKDYGIDLEVEIFEESEATGLTFKVQLKGTESTHGRTPSRSLRMNHIDYWRRLDVPVLVVLYVSDSRVLYAKWSFSHDPGMGGYSQKTTTMKFTDSDTLSAKISVLADEIVIYRSIAAGHIPHPVPLCVSSIDTQGKDWHWYRGLRDLVSEYELDEVIRVVPPTDNSAVKILINRRVIRLQLPLNASSMSMHEKQGYSLDQREMLDLALTLVAAQLAQRGHPEEGILVARRVGPNGAWINDDVTERLTGAFHDQREFELPLVVAKQLSHGAPTRTDLYYATSYLQVAQDLVEWMSEHDRERLLEIFDTCFGAYQRLGLTRHAVAQKIGSSSVLSSIDDHAGAVSMLLEAQTVMPEMADDTFFLGRVANSAFRDAQFSLAADYYRKIVDLGVKSNTVISELADSYFAAGNFEECMAVLSGSVGKLPDDRLSVINRLACDEVISQTGLKKQIPRDYTDEEIALIESNPEDCALPLLQAANALAFRPWLLVSGSPDTWTLGRAVLLGRLWLEYVPAWLMASVLAYHEHGPDSNELRAIVETGVVDAGDDFIDSLVEMAENADDAETRTHVEAIAELAKQFEFQNINTSRNVSSYGLEPMK